jgi:hypothetical protein|tara:strand:- start:622 stop:1068 length:447 start_codon:yes stop_codon:yes gene_type:complete
MRFIDCICGGTKYELLRNGKLECQHCGKWVNPFSGEHHKVIKDDGFHFFWSILTPHFIERMEHRVPEADTDDIVKASFHIEKVAKRNKFQCTKWNNHHLIWKYRFNERKKRLEMEFISVVPLGKFSTRLPNGYVIKNMEYVEVDFNGK